MQRAPGGAVTGGAIAAGGEVFTDRRAHQAAVGAMAVRAVIRMGVGRGAGQGVVVTAGAVGRCDLDQGAVVRGDRRMRRVPAGGVTGLTVAADGEVFTDRRAHQGTVAALWQFEQSVRCVVVSISASA